MSAYVGPVRLAGLSGAIATAADPIPVGLPSAGTVTIVSAQTNATGANWTAFPSQACTKLDIVNTTGSTIEYRRGGAGSSMPIPHNGWRMVIGITDASQISVRRVDQVGTPVTVSAEAFA